MSIPWLKKNPFMSAWLSTAHRVVGTLRVRATAQGKRQVIEAVNDVNSASTPTASARVKTMPKATPRLSAKPTPTSKPKPKPSAKVKAKPSLSRKR